MNKVCAICQGPVSLWGEAVVRGCHQATYHRCGQCGFIQVLQPDWLEEAYAEPINRSDTGYVARNLWAAEKVSAMVEASGLPAGATYLDYAAGYGLFVRLMRDRGYDFRWSDRYCTNLFARGFEAAYPLAASFAAITAFEVLEHLLDPLVTMDEILAHTSTFIFSTKLLPEPAPAVGDWWYYGLEHGQHIAFYSRKSLEVLASRYGYRLFTDGVDLHVLSRQEIHWTKPLAPTAPRWKFWKKPAPLEQAKRTPLTEADHAAIVAEQLRESEAREYTDRP